MPLASCTLIFLIESTNSFFASGTAASAARFIVRISSSAYLPMPTLRMSFSYFFSESGSGILTALLPKKPSVLPSRSTAAPEPFSSAAFRPDTASWLVSASRFARAGIVQPSSSARHTANETSTHDFTYSMPAWRACWSAW